MTREEAVRQLLVRYLEAGLVEGSVEKVLDCMADDVMGFGMGEQGFVSGKKEIAEVISTGLKEEVNVSYELEYDQLEIRFQCGEAACVCARVTIRRNTPDGASLSGLMQSLTMRLDGGRWKIAALHASPVILSEESIDAYPLRYAENTLAHLRDELQKETLDLMNRSISGGILSCYQNGEIPSLYFVNDSMLEYLDYSREDFTARFGGNVLEIFHPEDRDMVCSSAVQALQKNRDYEVRARLIRRGGTVRWMVARGRPGSDDTGREVLVSVFMDITELVEMQERLEKQAAELEAQAKELSISEERFRIALEKTSNIIFDYDIISGNIMHSSVPKKSMDFITNIQNAQNTLVMGGTVLDEFMDEFNWAFEAVRRGAPQSACTIKVRLATGKEVWNKISLTGIPDDHGRTVRAIGMIEDITREKEAEIAFAREEQYRQAILADAMASYVINFSRGIFEGCRISASCCLPVMPGDPYDTVILEETRTRLNDDDRRAYLNLFLRTAVMDRYRQGKAESVLEYRMIDSGGGEIWMRTTLHIVPDSMSGELKGFMYVTDIDRKKREELELKRRSEQDPMTGIFNKGATVNRIEEALKTYEGIQSGVFIMVDVDRFKDINDHYGHPYGDKVLVGVARVLRDNFRESDIVGRLGGDEFCVFFTGMRSPERVRQSAQAIQNGVSALAAAEDGREPITCSIGIAACGGVHKTFAQLYQEADQALYSVKDHGRNGCAFYEGAFPDR